MKRLVETNAPQIFIPTKKPELVESSIVGKNVIVVEGIFGKVNARNENNRRYPKTVWEKNLGESSPFRLRLKSRSVLGELEHPESGNTHLERVSHLITDAWVEHLTEARIKEMELPETVKEGDYVMGRYEILETPRGNILRALHEAKVQCGVSSRGRGDIRSVDGIDVVQDDYELDTWDAVYMPSVIEANPRAISEAGDLGSALPGAVDDGGTTDVTPTTTVQAADWKPEAEEVVRSMEDSVGGDKDITQMIPVLQRGINLIDQLASVDDEEAVKLKSQALTLSRVLTNEIMKREVGITSDKPKEKEPKKEESTKPVPCNLSESTKEQVENLVDGSIVTVTPKNLLNCVKENCPPEIIKFVEKQEDDVLVRICTKGKGGYVVRLLEPAFGESDIFVKYKDVKTAQTEIQEDEMKDGMKAMVEALVKDNDDLKTKLSSATPTERYEAAKQLIAGLAERLKSSKTGIPEVRYNAAKELISGLVEKVQGLEQDVLHEGKRVKAATKLIHKLVGEKKVTPADEPVVEGVKTEKVITEAAVKTEQEEIVESVASLTEAFHEASIESAKVRAKRILAEEETPAPVEEAPAPVEEAKPAEITTESKDLKKRLRGKAAPAPVEEAKPVAPANLMSAVAKRL